MNKGETIADLEAAVDAVLNGPNFCLNCGVMMNGDAPYCGGMECLEDLEADVVYGDEWKAFLEDNPDRGAR